MNQSSPAIAGLETATTQPEPIRADTLAEVAPASPAASRRQYTGTRHGETRGRVLMSLAQHPKTPGVVAADLNRNVNSIQQQLGKLLRSGVIVRLGVGLYGIGKNGLDELQKASGDASVRALVVVKS